MPCGYVGTSGWHYSHWQGVFYPQGMPKNRWLEHYAAHFDSVEINGSFYRLPSERAVRSWRDATPEGFRFSVKASRYITHMKKLREVADALKVFLNRMEHLGDKLGPVLFQLPPHWGVDLQRLEAFLSILPSGQEWVFEFRDPSWHCQDVYRLLRSRNAAFCVFDMAGFRSHAVTTADFAYLRLHGPGDAYCGRYGENGLRPWSAWLEEQRDLSRAYVYFDNDQAGYALEDARVFRRLVGVPPC